MGNRACSAPSAVKTRECAEASSTQHHGIPEESEFSSRVHNAEPWWRASSVSVTSTLTVTAHEVAREPRISVPLKKGVQVTFDLYGAYPQHPLCSNVRRAV
jgi:hypothetical protein